MKWFRSVAETDASPVITPLGSQWPVELYFKGIEQACREIPAETIVPILSDYAQNSESSASYYPWSALAFYRFKRADISNDISPAAFAKELRRIRDQALALNDAVEVLEGSIYSALANRKKFEGFARAFRDLLGDFAELDQHEDARLNYEEWRVGLALLSSGALTAAERIEGDQRRKTGISTRRGERVKGLDALVYVLGGVWIAITGRHPSAARVGATGEDDPKFVRFIQDLAESQNLSRADFSWKRIEAALNRTFRRSV
jgi:hypothetical protein